MEVLRPHLRMSPSVTRNSMRIHLLSPQSSVLSPSTRGFTLIETMLYIVIVAMVLSTLSFFLLQILGTREKTRSISEVVASAELIQARLSEAIRHASAIRTLESTFGTDPGILSLTMVDGARSPTVFSLTANDGQFQISEAGAPAVTVTPQAVRISNLVFTNLTTPTDTGIIQVQFTAEVTSQYNTRVFSYDQSFQTTLRIPLD